MKIFRPFLPVALLLALTGVAPAGTADTPLAQPLLEGEGLSWEHNQFHFKLRSVSEGFISSDTYVGDITLCYFWAEGNQSSVDQVGWLSQFWRQYRRLGVQFVGFCLDPAPKIDARAFQFAGGPFACVRLPSRLLIESQGPVKGLPMLLILSPGGVVSRKYEGLFSLEILEKDVLELLREKK